MRIKICSEEFDTNTDTEVPELTEIDNFEDNVLALDSKYKGIQAGLEGINTLMAIQTAISNPNNVQLSSSAKRFISITAENIKNNLHLDYQPFVISLESLDRVESKKVALEGLGDFIKAIYKAIVKTFKWIWDFIKSIFGYSSDKVKKAKKKAKKAEEEIKEIAKKVDSEDSPKELPNLSDEVVYPFKYLDKNLTAEDILDNITHLYSVLDNIKYIVEECLTTTKNVEGSLKSLISDDSTNISSTTVNAIGNSIDILVDNEQFLNTFIEKDKVFDDVVNIYKNQSNSILAKLPQKHANGVLLTFDRVMSRANITYDKESVRLIYGYAYGEMSAFYKRTFSDPNTNEIYKAAYSFEHLVMGDSIEYSKDITFKVPEIKDALLISAKVHSFVSGLDKKITDIKVIDDAVHVMHARIHDILETYIQLINKQGVTQQYFDSIKNINIIVSLLAAFTKEMGNSLISMTKTATALTNLSSEIVAIHGDLIEQ